jgi:hypothetical protein
VADQVEFSAYSKRELASLAKTFTAMGEDSVESARKVSYEIATLAKNEISSAAASRTKNNTAARRIAEGASISRTSKTGRLSYGFDGQRFSGGGSTKILWRGMEFGSKRFRQFPEWSGRYGRGSRGWFIYPSLRKIQPQLTLMWMKEVNNVIKNWKN